MVGAVPESAFFGISCSVHDVVALAAEGDAHFRTAGRAHALARLGAEHDVLWLRGEHAGRRYAPMNDDGLSVHRCGWRTPSDLKQHARRLRARRALHGFDVAVELGGVGAARIDRFVGFEVDDDPFVVGQVGEIDDTFGERAVV